MQCVCVCVCSVHTFMRACMCVHVYVKTNYSIRLSHLGKDFGVEPTLFMEILQQFDNMITTL